MAVGGPVEEPKPDESKKPGDAGDPKDPPKKDPSDVDKSKPPEPSPTPAKPPTPEPNHDPGKDETTDIPPKPIDGLNPAVLGDHPAPEVPPSLPSSLDPSALPEPKTEPPTSPEPKVEPAPMPAADSLPPTPEPKARETTPTPAPASSTPPADTSPMTPPIEPATMPAPSEQTLPPPSTAEAAPAPIPEPSPSSTPAPTPMIPPAAAPVGSTELVPTEPVKTPEPSPPAAAAPPPAIAPAGPVPADMPPTLETVPAGSIEPAGTKASTAGAFRAGWIAIPSGGRRIIGAVPIISTPAEAQIDTPRIADGPRVVDDPNAVDQVEPVVHTVQPGENFWTISKLYYRSPRFYKALHAANRGQVPVIDKLYVGTVLRIPPPEALDRALIDPPSRTVGDDPKTSTVSRTSNPRKVEPPSAELADLGMPARRRVVRPEVEADPEAEPERKPVRRPSYKIKEHDTLRSIARDTLSDPKRDREIYNLNRDVLDDIGDPLPVGTTLSLPSDAIVGRRSR